MRWKDLLERFDHCIFFGSPSARAVNTADAPTDRKTVVQRLKLIGLIKSQKSK